jgi:hypothetical protein
VCILENSYNQTLAYRIDGPGDLSWGRGSHDTDMIPWNFADINAHVPTKQDPETRSYTTVPLNRSSGSTFVYTPRDTESFSSNKPWVYTVVVASTFCLPRLSLSCLRTLWNGGKIVMNELVETAERLPL